MSNRLALVALAACAGPPTAQPAVANTSALPVRTTPAPRVSWSASEHRFVVDGLPAAARDIAVVAIDGGDGGRGYPNLHIEARDRDDRVTRTVPIIAANDWERLAPDGSPGPELDKRVAAANRELAELDVVTLPKLGMLGDHIATDGNIHVEWVDGLVDVIRQPAADAHPQRLAHGRYEGSIRAGNCENAAYLAGAYYSDGLNVVVVEIGYRGTDLCWEPAPHWHVLRW